MGWGLPDVFVPGESCGEHCGLRKAERPEGLRDGGASGQRGGAPIMLQCPMPSMQLLLLPPPLPLFMALEAKGQLEATCSCFTDTLA